MEIRPLFRKIRLRHVTGYLFVGGLLAVFLLVNAFGGYKASTNILLEKIAVSMILALSLSVVVGFLGELSLGHAGFMCVGAYLGGKIAVLVQPTLGKGVLPFLLSLVVGGLAAALCGFIIGLPALRLRGDYLAIVTLAFGEIVRVLFQQSPTFGGNLGLDTPNFDRRTFWIVALVLVLLTLFLTQNLIRSRHGRAITAIRDNEIAARACGIPVTRYKLVAFIFSAFFAGIAGVMFSYSNSTVLAPKFGYSYSIEILVMVVLGGMGNLTGTLLSATLITYLNVRLTTVLTGEMAVLKDLLYALVLVLIVIYHNAPALSAFRQKFGLRALCARLLPKKPDPAAVADDDARWENVPTKIRIDELLSVDVLPKESVADPDKGGRENE